MRVDTKKEANRTGRKKQKRNNSKKIKQLKGHERGCTKTIKKNKTITSEATKQMEKKDNCSFQNTFSRVQTQRWRGKDHNKETNSGIERQHIKQLQQNKSCILCPMNSYTQ